MTEKTIINRELPAPVITDGSHSILFMAQQISSGDHRGAHFEVDSIAFNFGAHVHFPDGTIVDEHLSIQDIINAWLTQIIEEHEDVASVAQ